MGQYDRIQQQWYLQYVTMLVLRNRQRVRTRPDKKLIASAGYYVKNQQSKTELFNRSSFGLLNNRPEREVSRYLSFYMNADITSALSQNLPTRHRD